MLKNLHFILLFFLTSVFTNNLVFSESKQLNKKVFDKVSPNVFTIKTSLNKLGHKHSYGSSFVIDKNGLLMTNYHVINQALHEPKKFKTFVNLNSKPIEANVVAFDIVHDLAIVKVNHKFKSEINLNKSNVKIRQGLKLFSLGIPKDLKLSINEGIMNGFIKSGPYEDILMSSPINSGMSGGPTVNAEGELVGVNVSILMGSDNISFSVPAKFAKNLFKKYKKLKKQLGPKINDFYYQKKNLHNEIQDQVVYSQKILMNDLLINYPNKDQFINFTDFKIKQSPKYLKCWFSNKDHKKVIYERKSSICILNKGTYLKDNKYFATYELKLETLKSKKLNKFLFYDLVNSVFSLKRIYNSIISKKSSEKDFSTIDDCKDQVIHGQNNIPFKVSYCLKGYLDYPKLYDIKIKGVSLLKEKKSIIMNASFYGFTSESIKKFITSWPNFIKLNDEKQDFSNKKSP